MKSEKSHLEIEDHADGFSISTDARDPEELLALFNQWGIPARTEDAGPDKKRLVFDSEAEREAAGEVLQEYASGGSVMAERARPDAGPSLEVPVTLQELARLLRSADHLDPEGREKLARLLEYLARALADSNLTAEEQGLLRDRAINLARAVYERHSAGLLSAARDRLEEAALRVAAEAPLATGIARQIAEALATIGISPLRPSAKSFPRGRKYEQERPAGFLRSRTCEVNSMEYRPFGPTGREVPVIGQGTWYSESEDRATAIAALQQGLELGMTHIDTAEMYLSGEAEEWVGEAIAGRRDEVFLVSKVLPQNASRTGTLAACARSLARLKTDRLDCYLLHWRGEYPLEDTIAAFERLKLEGKILSWGVSNFDEADLDHALAIAGEGRLACDQVLYHLRERAIEHAVLPWCEHHGAAVVAYSPFGHGNFPGPHTPGGRVLREIAAEHHATARQVALRFLVRWLPLFAIPKSSRIEHVVENAGAGDLRLSEVDLARIDAAFPRGPRPAGLPML
jgi:diketogulonate reductase-like aldo/keto reductase